MMLFGVRADATSKSQENAAPELDVRKYGRDAKGA
jgi:hypothetical protein